MTANTAGRVSLSLDGTQKARLFALAKFDNKAPATLAKEIVLEYMATREGDIEKVLAANAVFEQAVDELRKQKSTEDD